MTIISKFNDSFHLSSEIDAFFTDYLKRIRREVFNDPAERTPDFMRAAIAAERITNELRDTCMIRLYAYTLEEITKSEDGLAEFGFRKLIPVTYSMEDHDRTTSLSLHDYLRDIVFRYEDWISLADRFVHYRTFDLIRVSDKHTGAEDAMEANSLLIPEPKMLYSYFVQLNPAIDFS